MSRVEAYRCDFPGCTSVWTKSWLEAYDAGWRSRLGFHACPTNDHAIKFEDDPVHRWCVIDLLHDGTTRRGEPGTAKLRVSSAWVFNSCVSTRFACTCNWEDDEWHDCVDEDHVAFAQWWKHRVTIERERVATELAEREAQAVFGYCDAPGSKGMTLHVQGEGCVNFAPQLSFTERFFNDLEGV